jgi:hypothetical protein
MGSHELLVVLGLSAFGAGLITSSKGRGFFLGFLLGGLLGLIGVLVAAFLGSSTAPTPEELRRKECPHCKEEMRADASVCPHCQRESTPWRFHEGHWWMKGAGDSDFYFDTSKNEWIRFVPLDLGARSD